MSWQVGTGVAKGRRRRAIASTTDAPRAERNWRPASSTPGERSTMQIASVATIAGVAIGWRREGWRASALALPPVAVAVLDLAGGRSRRDMPMASARPTRRS